MIDLTFVTPSIRPQDWEAYYNSITKACKKYTWEVIFITPFDHKFDRPNVKIIKSFKSPTACVLQGIEAAQGEFVTNAVDDSLFIEDTLDRTMDWWQTNHDQNKTICNFRYVESTGRTNRGDFPLTYWKAWSHTALQLPGIPQQYDISLHWTIKKSLFYKLGGIDSIYHYVNFGGHDFIFRAQYQGVNLVNSPVTVSIDDNIPGSASDHGAIITADHLDQARFTQDYRNPHILSIRSRIDFTEDYKTLPEIWPIRFNKNNLPISHAQLV